MSKIAALIGALGFLGTFAYGVVAFNRSYYLKNMDEAMSLRYACYHEIAELEIKRGVPYASNGDDCHYIGLEYWDELGKQTGG